MRKLKGLLKRGELIPVGGDLRKVLLRLSTAVEDGGRYCICEGFNDGSLMIGCEVCSQWFHARCVLRKPKPAEPLTEEKEDDKDAAMADVTAAAANDDGGVADAVAPQEA